MNRPHALDLLDRRLANLALVAPSDAELQSPEASYH
jgi:hypothetical protein